MSRILECHTLPQSRILYFVDPVGVGYRSISVTRPPKGVFQDMSLMSLKVSSIEQMPTARGLSRPTSIEMRFEFCLPLELTPAPFRGLEFISLSFSGVADATTFHPTPMIPRYSGMTVNIGVFMISRELDVLSHGNATQDGIGVGPTPSKRRCGGFIWNV